LKKQFVFRVYAADKVTVSERIVAQFLPHPIKANRPAEVSVAIPSALKTTQVMIFFGEDSNKTYSTKLIKKQGELTETWKGSVKLPVGIEPGEYSATLFVKNQGNKFFKKRLIYSVIE